MTASATRPTPRQDDWRAVLATLVAERGDALIRYARLISGNSDDAADLVQDALVKTFGRLRNGFTVASAEAYVRRTILNSYLDGGRRTSRWRRIAHFTATPELQESSASTTDARVDLDGQLARLSPRERACIVLRYYDDLTVAGVAERLNISPGTVKRYLSDALAKLGAALDTPESTSDSTPEGTAENTPDSPTTSREGSNV
ncbi:MAG: SigE family RNA polymerase sigma factor [Lacisediminihabitans sp.]